VRRLRLATILALLVLATIVPLSLFAGWLIWSAWRQQQTLVARQNVDFVRAVSAAVDYEIGATFAALNTLGSLDAVEASDLSQFHALAVRMLPIHPEWQALRLVTPDGTVLINTDVPFGEASGLLGTDWVDAVRTTLRPAISTLRQDPRTKGFYVTVAVPVMRNGRLVYALGAQVQAATLAATLQRQTIPPPGVVTLLDANGTIIARTLHGERYAGRKPHPSFTAAVRRSREESWRSMLLEGIAAYSAHSTSSTTGLTVGMGMPAESVDAQTRRSFLALSAAGAATLAGGLILALILGHRIVRSQLAAAAAAKTLAAGHPMSLRGSRIAEIEDLGIAMRDAAAILDRRLQERNEALQAERQARAAGERNEARLAVTLRSIGDAVITTDPDGRVTLLNPVAQALTGWPEAEAIGQPIGRVFSTIDEATRAPLDGPLARVAQGDPSAGVPTRSLLLARDGRAVPVADSAAPIVGADGARLGAIVVFRDVSAQHQAERERAGVLEREQAARRAAEALNRAKDEFVATVSHELRTPLNAIFGWIAMLRAGTLSDDRRAHAIDVIYRNTRAQAQLIEDLLDMSRVIRGAVRLDMQPIDLSVALDAAVDSLRPSADLRKIAVNVHAPRDLAQISGDQSRVQQILFNLLSNSLKFTPQGGRIEARMTVEEDQAVVRVTDTGEGIAPEFLPHVFDRFRQERSDVTRAHSGLGIGLSLVRHLTELHGGSVDASSPGKGLGATFTLRLPLLGAPAAVRGPADVAPLLPAPGEPILGGLRALVVDDDDDGRELVAIALRQAGAEVKTAASVAQATASIEIARPDLIVTDIAMPLATGYDLVRQLRADPSTCTLPVIALTAYSRLEDREHALAAGFDAHVGKPFDPRALVGLLAGLAGRV
jgi:PAS domain S-box-containing protein